MKEVPGLSASDILELQDEGEQLIDLYPDTMLLVARYAGGEGEATAVTGVEVDGAGVTLHVSTRSGENRSTRVDYSIEPKELGEARMALYSFLAMARGAAPDDEPLTSLEKEFETTATLKTYESRVTSIKDINPSLREITVTGEWEGYQAPGEDQYLLAILDEPTAPEGHVQAYYTVRRWRPELGEMDLWFVLHGDHGNLSRWAATAVVGDHLELWGPRASFRPPEGTSSLLLVADDTGLPAMAAIMEQTDLPATVIIETFDSDHEVDLAVGPNRNVRWLHRNGAEPGTGTALLAAVRSLDLRTKGLYAFGGAESRQITAVRKYLRAELGMPLPQVSMTGYWRRKRTLSQG